MNSDQTRQNPDVNTFNIDETDPGEQPGNESGSDGTTEDIPVPPDTEQRVPIEEPPGAAGPPVGDVDDSPKRIAQAGISSTE